MAEDIQEIIDVMQEMIDDETVPKSVREKLTNCISILNKGEENNLMITKVLDELEDVTENANLESYTRTQIWDLVRLLEGITIVNN